MCGFVFSYIGGIERGQNNVSVRNLEKIAIALEVDISEFFFDYDSVQVKDKINELDEILRFLTTLDDEQLRKATDVLKLIFK